MLKIKRKGYFLFSNKSELLIDLIRQRGERRIVFLNQQVEEFAKLIVLYKGYTGQLTKEEAEAAGIKEEYIITKESLAETGKDLKANDYSEKGEMLRQYKAIMQLAGRFTTLGNLETPAMNQIYNNALQLTQAIKDKMYDEAERLVSLSCDLKLNMVNVEKQRFEDKANLGLNGGIEEFNYQINNMQSMMTSWLSDMKEKLYEADTKWKAKQVSFVTQRGEWIEKVRNKQTSQSDDEITALKQNLKELTDTIDTDMTKEKSDAEKASSYIKQVAMPTWMSDYEVMANRLFGVLHKKDIPKDEAISAAVADLKEQMDALDKEKKDLELMQLIHELKIAQKQLEEQTEGIISGYSENIGSILLSNGWTKSSGNYKRTYMQSYTLLGGAKKDTIVIDGFQSATKITDKVKSTKANVEKLASEQKQVSNPDLFTVNVYTEIERIKTVAVELFGNENKAGKIWTEYIGRMPTSTETSEYIQEKSGANTKSWLAKFTKWFADLFKGNKKDTQNEDKQEDLLTKSISSGKNKKLETGRIMLEFQMIESIEQQAIATRDGGIMNIPLFEGGPSLSSVGSIALNILAPGAGLAGSLLFQMGSGLINVATASEEYRDDAAMNMMKGMATSLVSYGMGSLTNTFKAGLNLTNDLHGILTNSLIDAGSSFATSTINSAINAFGPDGWNSDAFAGGLASGLLSSGSTFVGSSVSNGINVALGASWNNGGYNFQIQKSGDVGINDYFNSSMKKLGGLAGNLVEQTINNKTGVADGYTFNILNAADFGIKDKKGNLNTTGLFAVTLGGSKGLSAGISSDGYDLSYSGIKDMVFGMNRVKDYNTAMADKTGVMQKIYAVQNYALYSGLSYDSDFVQALDAYMFNGNPDELSFNFDTEDNKKEGNTIYIDKKLISGLISTHNGVIGDINQMAVLTAKIGHEYKHDGKNGADEEVTKQVQGILSANPSLSKAQLKELLLAQGMDEEDVDKAIGNVFEDISCHAFEASIWGGLKGVFGVKDSEEDIKLAYLNINKEAFIDYIAFAYTLGQEHDRKKASEKETYENARKDLENKKNDKNKDKYKNAFFAAWSGYITYLKTANVSDGGINNLDQYTIQDFQLDLKIAFGLSLLKEGANKETLTQDYLNLINNMCGENGYLEQGKDDIEKAKIEAKYKDIVSGQFVEVFEKLFTTGKDGKYKENSDNVSKFKILVNDIASKFNTSSIGYTNSSMWFFELFNKDVKNMSSPTDYYNASNMNSFMNYYMGENKEKLQQIANLLNDKNIAVTDSLNNGNNTHFIANADFLITAFTELGKAEPGRAEWTDYTWKEGWRSYEEFKQIYKEKYKYTSENVIFYKYKGNGHAQNVAIDIMINGYDDWKTKLNDLWDFAVDRFKNKKFSTIELKDGGFHLQQAGKGKNQILFGNTKKDSYEVYLKYMQAKGYITKEEADLINYWMGVDNEFQILAYGKGNILSDEELKERIEKLKLEAENKKKFWDTYVYTPLEYTILTPPVILPYPLISSIVPMY
jgi:hypothetical protein